MMEELFTKMPTAAEFRGHALILEGAAEEIWQKKSDFEPAWAHEGLARFVVGALAIASCLCLFAAKVTEQEKLDDI